MQQSPTTVPNTSNQQLQQRVDQYINVLQNSIDSE